MGRARSPRCASTCGPSRISIRRHWSRLWRAQVRSGGPRGGARPSSRASSHRSSWFKQLRGLGGWLSPTVTRLLRASAGTLAPSPVHRVGRPGPGIFDRGTGIALAAVERVGAVALTRPGTRAARAPGPARPRRRRARPRATRGGSSHKGDRIPDVQTLPVGGRADGGRCVVGRQPGGAATLLAPKGAPDGHGGLPPRAPPTESNSPRLVCATPRSWSALIPSDGHRSPVGPCVGPCVAPWRPSPGGFPSVAARRTGGSRSPIPTFDTPRGAPYLRRDVLRAAGRVGDQSDVRAMPGVR